MSNTHKHMCAHTQAHARAHTHTHTHAHLNKGMCYQTGPKERIRCICLSEKPMSECISYRYRVIGMHKGEPNATWRPCAPSKHDVDSNLQIKMYGLSSSKEKNLKK